MVSEGITVTVKVGEPTALRVVCLRCTLEESVDVCGLAAAERPLLPQLHLPLTAP